MSVVAALRFHQSDDPRGCRRGSYQFQWKDADLESVCRKGAKIGQLLHMPVGLALANAVALPEDVLAVLALRPRNLMLEGCVPTPLVDAHHGHALVDQPFGRCGTHAGAALPVFRCSEVTV